MIDLLDERFDFLMLVVVDAVAPVIAPLDTLTRDFLFTALASRVGDNGFGISLKLSWMSETKYFSFSTQFSRENFMKLSLYSQ